MKRDIDRLSTETFDLLVIGGGISGACIAWDGVLRGLSVALVDKEDFCHATSANSLKVIHGGLRYLQDANPWLVRTMIHERKTFMRIAPHLVHPIPFVLPTHGHGLRSKEVMAVALGLNDLLGFDRNQIEDPQKYIPNGRVISKAECLQILPGIAEQSSLTGGSIWYDGQIYNSEQLCLAFLHSADYQGAALANYVEVNGLVMKRNRVIGVTANDGLSGGELEIRARLVVNATGPWIDQVLSLLNQGEVRKKFHASLAMNLITKQIVPDLAIGINTKSIPIDNANPIAKHTPTIFMIPWRGYSLIGTAHVPYQCQLDKPRVSKEHIQDFLELINTAYPAARLRLEDVRFVHHGLLPVSRNGISANHLHLLRQGRIFDHQVEDEIEGLITILGVKYTSARLMAEKVLDLVLKRLKRALVPCQTHVKQINGGEIDSFNDFLTMECLDKPPGLEAKHIDHLIRTYGSEYRQVLCHIDEDTDTRNGGTVLSKASMAEVLYAIREGMAQKLPDVVLRRTDLGVAGKPTEETLRCAAAIMAKELGWDRNKKDQEIKDVEAIYTALALQE